MGNDDKAESVHSASEGGLTAIHPDNTPLSLWVGPTTSSEFNRVKLGLIPIACWRVDDIRFDFGSSFVLPAIAAEMRDLAALLQQHPGCPISIFGHADPVGSDDYNKILSGRRAAAIYGLLTRRTDIWEDLFSNTGVFTNPSADDKWGNPAIQTMQDAVPAQAKPSSAGERKQLYLAYMDAVAGQDLKLGKTDFLAAGLDAKGKGDYQGCSEFNPVMIFSQEDNQRFDQGKADNDSAVIAERNQRNSPNRRVMILVFRKNSRVTPAKWPCPRVTEGVTGCTLRFFSDGDKRRARRLPNEPREFNKTEDTFACRFYQRISNGSPCEGVLYTFRIRLFDRFGRPTPHARYQIEIDGEQSSTKTADERGDIFIRTRKTKPKCVVRWTPVQPDDVTPEAPESGSPEEPL